MHIKTCLLTLLLLVLSSAIFANSDIYVASTKDSKFKFNKREKIILALPRNPSELEQSFVDSIRQHLVEQKFKLVDSVQNADRILTFRIFEDAKLNFDTYVHTGWYQELKAGQPSVQEGLITSNSDDSGYTIIEMSMQDIGLLKEGSERSTIWQSSVSTKSTNFDEFPLLVLEKLIKLYGKNKVDKDKLKKPKKREKK